MQCTATSRPSYSMPTTTGPRMLYSSSWRLYFSTAATQVFTVLQYNCYPGIHCTSVPLLPRYSLYFSTIATQMFRTAPTQVSTVLQNSCYPGVYSTSTAATRVFRVCGQLLPSYPQYKSTYNSQSGIHSPQIRLIPKYPEYRNPAAVQVLRVIQTT
jgi:hypothetical protein